MGEVAVVAEGVGDDGVEAGDEQDDVLVSFGVSLTDLSAEPGVKGVVTADMLERIAMTPRTAKRLTLTLIQSLREYEARFGEIAVEEKAPEEE